MNAPDRARLTAALREHVAAIAADLREKLLAAGPARERAEQLRTDERVGESYEVWTDLLSRRAAVLWVLKSVYVRVLEDRGLVAPGRLLDREAQDLFERLAPHLGETAFLRWVYRDLASPRGGLPELFSPQPAEIVAPSDERSRALIALWRHRDADTGAAWRFAEETFEGELMGDLYQELDPVVKDRFALCQTPDFVRGFILDRTLTPAIEAFGADTVRLLDPACGSGHFLIDGLKRLVAATAAAHPDWTRRATVQHALGRVVGVDLNDYACALARTRLIMTAAELAGVTTLGDAAGFHPHVYWADGLEQVERDEAERGPAQGGLFDGAGEPRVLTTFTRSDVRAALREVFAERFHAVVANPPYILEHDVKRKEYHREILGKARRYVSATGKYSLASPFTECCFQLAETDGFVGIITSNNFMKREFGRALIEKVLRALDLTLVVDTSQAYIPFHGTPTVLLFGRNREPAGDGVRAVLGKRGESGTPDDPAHGKVWSSIVAGWGTVGFESEYVSVADVPRSTFGRHPWSLGGGGASDLKATLEAAGAQPLGQLASAVGITCVTGEDEVYVLPETAVQRLDVGQTRPLVIGEGVRDWALESAGEVVFPYSADFKVLPQAEALREIRYLSRYYPRTRHRRRFGTPMVERGLSLYELQELYPDKLRTPLSITFAFVATHNHFVLDRGGKVFKQSAPVIKLPPGATEDDHFALLGLLNASTACFWMKQVFHCKGSQGINEGAKSAAWEQFFEFDATKAKLFPVANDSAATIPYARRLDALARDRQSHDVASVLADPSWSDARALRARLDARRHADDRALSEMVALQEELDWRCYRLYGLDDVDDTVPPDAVEPLLPTQLPWCLTFAARDAEHRAALARGEEPTEQPSAWFERHGWTADPTGASLAALSADTRARIEARRVRTRTHPALALIEAPNFKRRWYRPDHAADEQAALTAWLADRVEAVARERARPFPLDPIVAAMQGDPRVLAVCEVLTGRPDFDLAHRVAEVLHGDAVPNHPLHLYKPTGLAKRAAWERTWDAQRREDAGEAVTPEVPPAYGTGDFLRTEHWQLRGKLDVPKERFIAFTEVPGRAGPAETLYGWAGWTPVQRLKALLAIDEDLDDAGVPLADRIGVLDSAWRLLPDVTREDPAAAVRLQAELQALVGPTGPSAEQLADWKQRFPPPSTRAAKGARARRRAAPGTGPDDQEPAP